MNKKIYQDKIIYLDDNNSIVAEIDFPKTGVNEITITPNSNTTKQNQTTNQGKQYSSDISTSSESSGKLFPSTGTK